MTGKSWSEWFELYFKSGQGERPAVSDADKWIYLARKWGALSERCAKLLAEKKNR